MKDRSTPETRAMLPPDWVEAAVAFVAKQGIALSLSEAQMNEMLEDAKALVDNVARDAIKNTFYKVDEYLGSGSSRCVLDLMKKSVEQNRH